MIIFVGVYLQGEMLTKKDQYLLMDKIVRAACEVGELSYPSFIARKKSLKTNTLRGVTCLISRYMLIHPNVSALLLCRTRQNVINCARRYHHYIQAKDAITLKYFEDITHKIQIYDE